MKCKTLRIRMTAPVERLLKRLHRTGLYGNTVEEVGERLMCRELAREVRLGLKQKK